MLMPCPVAAWDGLPDGMACCILQFARIETNEGATGSSTPYAPPLLRAADPSRRLIEKEGDGTAVGLPPTASPPPTADPPSTTAQWGFFLTVGLHPTGGGRRIEAGDRWS